jgi:hypothetical protein
VFLVFSILLLVFMNWLFYHIRTDIAVNAATTSSVSCKPISGVILKNYNLNLGFAVGTLFPKRVISDKDGSITKHLYLPN